MEWEEFHPNLIQLKLALRLVSDEIKVFALVSFCKNMYVGWIRILAKLLLRCAGVQLSTHKKLSRPPISYLGLCLYTVASFLPLLHNSCIIGYVSTICIVWHPKEQNLFAHNQFPNAAEFALYKNILHICKEKAETNHACGHLRYQDVCTCQVRNKNLYEKH